MTRRTSSSRWSRPATGKQIAALKAHGNYDSKYYSIGRASKVIGSSINGSSHSGRRTSPGRASYPTSFSSSYVPSSFLSQLLDVNDDVDSVLAAALVQASREGPSPQGDDTPVESVAFTVSPDESNPAEPRIVFEAAVIRDKSFAGEPTLEVRFVSNVDFGEPPPSTPQGFTSGVQFDD